MLGIVVQEGFPSGSDSKESASNAGDPGWIPGSGRSPGEENGYHPVFLPVESQGQRNLVGNSPWGRKEEDTTEQPTHTVVQGFKVQEGDGDVNLQMFGKCFLSYAVTVRCREEFYQTLLDSSLSTCLVYTIVIMVVLPSWNRPSNILQAVRERSKILPNSSGP